MARARAKGVNIWPPRLGMSYVKRLPSGAVKGKDTLLEQHKNPRLLGTAIQR